jgi:hypothetical protein
MPTRSGSLYVAICISVNEVSTTFAVMLLPCI